MAGWGGTAKGTSNQNVEPGPARALDADAAAHEFHHFPRDGQAEAGAAEFPGRGGVGLDERLEQFFGLLRGQADAGVGDLKPQ